MAVKKKIDLLDIVQKIVNVDPKMRFAAIIDSKGNIREGIMKKGQTSLNSQKAEEHFCIQETNNSQINNDND